MNIELNTKEKNTLLDLIFSELTCISRLISEYREDSQDEELKSLETTEKELEELYKKIKGE